MDAITPVNSGATSAPNNRGEDNSISDEAAALEATELRAYIPDPQAHSPSAAALENPSVRSIQSLAYKVGPFSLVRKFWSRQVVITVPHDACRDHLGVCVFMHVSCFYAYDIIQVFSRIDTGICLC